MPRFRDLRRGPARDGAGDAGFTLVEILVAFLIIAIIAAAGTSLTIRGMRATLEAKQLSQAKNILNEQIEQMRGLPYHVANTTSAAKVDVLDTYFPNLTAAGAASCSADATTWITNKSSWSGYVATAAGRCSFEPAIPFYRTVLDKTLPGSGQAAVITSTQFLGLATGDGTAPLPVAPHPGYAWNATGLDYPAAGQISAYATAVFGQPGAAAKRTTTRTDIADRRGGPALVSAETNAAAVVVDGTLAGGVPDVLGEPLRLEIGTVTGSGDVTVVTKAAVEAVGASMQTATGRVAGASKLANSPGTANSAGFPNAVSSPPYLSIDVTQTSDVSATSTVANPGYGAAKGAVASAAGGSFRFDLNRTDLELEPLLPVVAVDANAPAGLSGGSSCPSTSGDYGAAGSGWMKTDVSPTVTLAACAQSAASTVRLFPTADAPEGLIQIVASDIIARCEVTTSGASATTSGEVSVRWMTPALTYSAWTTITLTGTTPSGSLDPRLEEPLPNSKKIRDYIASWPAFGVVEKFPPTTGGRTATARIPAALALTTVPLRKLPSTTTDDPDSAVRVSIGRAQCSATDIR